MLRWDDIAVTLKQNFYCAGDGSVPAKKSVRASNCWQLFDPPSQPAASNYFAEICRDRANGDTLAAGGSARDSGSRRAWIVG
jgi:hypothetical protein